MIASRVDKENVPRSNVDFDCTIFLASHDTETHRRHPSGQKHDAVSDAKWRRVSAFPTALQTGCSNARYAFAITKEAERAVMRYDQLPDFVGQVHCWGVQMWRSV